MYHLYMNNAAVSTKSGIQGWGCKCHSREILQDVVLIPGRGVSDLEELFLLRHIDIQQMTAKSSKQNQKTVVRPNSLTKLHKV